VSRTKRAGGAPPKVCCMVSEFLEEAGIDRGQLRRVRRQVLEGIILLCRWQLQRMEEKPPGGPRGAPRNQGRRVRVE